MKKPFFLRLERIHLDRNERRFYEIFIEDDFFDGQSLMVRWGRIGHPGRLRVHHSGRMEDLKKQANQLAQGKVRRGYCGIA
jgi:predicted DNA-binding WGR domain protein